MSDLQEEQKRLYKKAEENDIKLLKEEINRLNNIIDKAIEYINEMCLCSDGYANYGDDLRPEYIINILQGSDKE